MHMDSRDARASLRAALGGEPAAPTYPPAAGGGGMTWEAVAPLTWDNDLGNSSKLERLSVPGGWLYRSMTIPCSPTPEPSVSMAFVPETTQAPATTQVATVLGRVRCLRAAIRDAGPDSIPSGVWVAADRLFAAIADLDDPQKETS